MLALQGLIKQSLLFWFLLITIFGLHRLLSFSYLNGGTPWSYKELGFLTVGLLSDAWVAFLITAITLLVAMPLSLSMFKRVAFKIVAVPVFFLFGILTVVHQPYVEFFRAQFVPFHISYLWDLSFLQASYSSMLNTRALLIFTSVVAFSVFLCKVGPAAGKEKRYILLFFIAAVVSLAAHSANIHYRHLLVPPELQVNVLERLYYHLKAESNPEPLSSEEWVLLTSRLGNGKKLFDTLRPAVEAAEASPLLRGIRRQVQKLILHGEKPILLTVLLESARPSDFGAYNPDELSITPNFDELALTGVLFMKAYSTGTVTRGGQEAVWCGYFGARDTSMMRGRGDVRIPCLPSLLGAEAEFFWIHGGNGEFDNQRSFWHSQGVRHIVDVRGFPVETVKSDWGISDKALFSMAAEEISQIRETSSKDLIVGMVLTLTNHIPWTVPEDAAELPEDSERFSLHPSFATTAYTDHAFGIFTRKLKELDLWSKTVLVVASDHGTIAPPFHKLRQSEPLFHETSRSHINLVLSGGIIEQMVAKSSARGIKIHDWVSQADVAPFLAYLTGREDLRFMGSPLLATERLTPVISDLGDAVFMPGELKVVDKGELMQPQFLSSDAEGQFARVYYRAFLQAINEVRVKDKAPRLSKNNDVVESHPPMQRREDDAGA